MIEENALKFAIAGFLHDIGKFAGPKILDVSNEYKKSSEALYQPKAFKDSRYTHIHALYSAAFFEHSSIAPFLPSCFRDPDWGEGGLLQNLAAMHHKPETSYQAIITQADRLSSGWERRSYEEYTSAVSPADYLKTRVNSVFARLACNNSKDNNTKWIYDLKKLSAHSIFPKQEKEKDKQEALKDYQELFSSFLIDLESLSDKTSNLPLWFQHLESLFLHYAAFIPSARAGNVVPDVSLYDHSKVTAALATALYQYHKATDTLTKEAIEDCDDKRFLFVGGDLLGIQNFIFHSGGLKKYRAKLIRGRSFQVSLFAELAASLMCYECGIPKTSICYATAGQFVILCANTEETKQGIERAKTRIQKWLIEHFRGITFLPVSQVEAKSADLTGGNFKAIQIELIRRRDRMRYQPFDLVENGGVIANYLEEIDKHGACPLCRQRAANVLSDQDESLAICDCCADQIFLGNESVKNSELKVYFDADSAGELHLPVFGKYQIDFKKSNTSAAYSDDSLHQHWQIGVGDRAANYGFISQKRLAGYVPTISEEDISSHDLIEGDIGSVKSFKDIIQGEGEAFEALGVFRADLDDLGYTLHTALKGDQFTLARFATMSRLLDSFFSVYLPVALKEQGFENVYTVFGGGDDLFLIGYWRDILALAPFLRKEFSKFVCNSNGITFSAGITLHKDHTPVDFLAEAAEIALEESKAQPAKNAVTLFGETITWDEFDALKACKTSLEAWLNDGLISSRQLYNLGEYTKLAAKEKQVLESPEGVNLADIECFKWRAMLRYSLSRNVKQSSAESDHALEQIAVEVTRWLESYRSKFRIPLWEVLYEKRRS